MAAMHCGLTTHSIKMQKIMTDFLHKNEDNPGSHEKTQDF